MSDAAQQALHRKIKCARQPWATIRINCCSSIQRGDLLIALSALLRKVTVLGWGSRHARYVRVDVSRLSPHHQRSISDHQPTLPAGPVRGSTDLTPARHAKSHHFHPSPHHHLYLFRPQNTRTISPSDARSTHVLLTARRPRLPSRRAPLFFRMASTTVPSL